MQDDSVHDRPGLRPRIRCRDEPGLVQQREWQSRNVARQGCDDLANGERRRLEVRCRHLERRPAPKRARERQRYLNLIQAPSDARINILLFGESNELSPHWPTWNLTGTVPGVWNDRQRTCLGFRYGTQARNRALPRHL